MMKAFLLPSGEILYPRRAEGPDGVTGFGWAFAAPNTEEHATWKPWAEKAPPAAVAMASRLKVAIRKAR